MQYNWRNGTSNAAGSLGFEHRTGKIGRCDAYASPPLRRCCVIHTLNRGEASRNAASIVKIVFVIICISFRLSINDDTEDKRY